MINKIEVEKNLLDGLVFNYYVILDLKNWFDNGYTDIDQLNKRLITSLFDTYGGDLYHLDITLLSILDSIKDINFNVYNTLVKYV